MAELGHFLLWQTVDAAVLFHLLDLAHAGDGLADRGIVGQRSAKPTVHDIGLFVFIGHLAQRLLGLLLGADKQNLAPAGHGVIKKLAGLLQPLQGLLQVNDVDAAAPSEQILAHLGVPAFGAVPEVKSGFEQILDGDVFTDVRGRGVDHGVFLS